MGITDTLERFRSRYFESIPSASIAGRISLNHMAEDMSIEAAAHDGIAIEAAEQLSAINAADAAPNQLDQPQDAGVEVVSQEVLNQQAYEAEMRAKVDEAFRDMGIKD
jgi:hypothetical protein